MASHGVQVFNFRPHLKGLLSLRLFSCCKIFLHAELVKLNLRCMHTGTNHTILETKWLKSLSFSFLGDYSGFAKASAFCRTKGPFQFRPQTTSVLPKDRGPAPCGEGRLTPQSSDTHLQVTHILG